MKLVLPYPPSSNRYWRNWRGRMVVSEEARQYRAVVRIANAKSIPLAVDVRAEVLVYRPRKARDLDNCLKVVLDALIGVAYNDDCQVSHIVAVRFDDKENPRVEVTVEAA